MPYNPLDIRNLAASVVAALESEPLTPLSSVVPFNGAGLYALYYRGDFQPYRRLAEYNTPRFRTPIYVGKAVIDNARKGGAEFDDESMTDELYQRIVKHRRSIAAAANLDVADFMVRYLVTMPVWVPLAETVIISRYRPLWNVAVEGFGNNDPGGRRRSQYRSVWDILHPGRGWATKQAENPVARADIEQRVSAHLTEILPDESPAPNTPLEND